MRHREFKNVSLSGKALAVILLCLLSSCDKPKEPPMIPVAFMMLDVEGFRLRMTPRVANLVAEKNGWTLDTIVALCTFEDIIEGKADKQHNTVCLKRGENKTIRLGFDHGVLDSISCTIHSFENEQAAEDLLKWYLNKIPNLKISDTTDYSRTYLRTEGNGLILVNIFLGGNSSSVSVEAVYDF